LNSPHGGGGPGVGYVVKFLATITSTDLYCLYSPICVAEHLAPFLPTHPVISTGGSSPIGAVAAAPWGSASILLISWAYIKMLGGKGLADSTKLALLNANYIAHRLNSHYSLRYKNKNNRVAHELLIDLAEFDKKAGLKVADFAKRLQVCLLYGVYLLSGILMKCQDYGFHPPTCSWPTSTCMLIEPTESESLHEIDKYMVFSLYIEKMLMHLTCRFCDAMIAIRQEAEDIITGKQPKDNNLLKNAPHPISAISLSDTEWNRPYSREKAVYPLPYLRQRKFWPTISRIDDGILSLLFSVCLFTDDILRSLRRFEPYCTFFELHFR